MVKYLDSNIDRPRVLDPPAVRFCTCPSAAIHVHLLSVPADVLHMSVPVCRGARADDDALFIFVSLALRPGWVVCHPPTCHDQNVFQHEAQHEALRTPQAGKAQL